VLRACTTCHGGALGPDGLPRRSTILRTFRVCRRGPLINFAHLGEKNLPQRQARKGDVLKRCFALRTAVDHAPNTPFIEAEEIDGRPFSIVPTHLPAEVFDAFHSSTQACSRRCGLSQKNRCRAAAKARAADEKAKTIEDPVVAVDEEKKQGGGRKSGAAS